MSQQNDFLDKVEQLIKRLEPAFDTFFEAVAPTVMFLVTFAVGFLWLEYEIADVLVGALIVMLFTGVLFQNQSLRKKVRRLEQKNAKLEKEKAFAEGQLEGVEILRPLLTPIDPEERLELKRLKEDEEERVIAKEQLGKDLV